MFCGEILGKLAEHSGDRNNRGNILECSGLRSLAFEGGCHYLIRFGSAAALLLSWDRRRECASPLSGCVCDARGRKRWGEGDGDLRGLRVLRLILGGFWLFFSYAVSMRKAPRQKINLSRNSRRLLVVFLLCCPTFCLRSIGRWWEYFSSSLAHCKPKSMNEIKCTFLTCTIEKQKKGLVFPGTNKNRGLEPENFLIFSKVHSSKWNREHACLPGAMLNTKLITNTLHIKKDVAPRRHT